PEGKTMCSLCSRLRRGALYTYAEQNGFTRIALGHHRDDMVATFFLNLFFHARLSGMPPKLLSDDGRHVVIRPLAYVREADIAAYAEHRGFPIIPCNLCGSQENLQRKQVQKMMAQWERESPGRIETIARALGDIRPSQLADPGLFDFLPPARRRPMRTPGWPANRTPRRATAPDPHRRDAAAAPAAPARRRRPAPFPIHAPFPDTVPQMFFRNLTMFRFPTSLDLSSLEELL